MAKTQTRLKIIDKLPQMRMSDIMRLWENALRLSGGRTRSAVRSQTGPQADDARLVLDAIQKEWVRRGKLPPKEDEFFRWPSTEAAGGNGKLLSPVGWIKDGVLSYMGYRVGSTNGRSTPTRQRILHEVFSGPLPPVFPPAYLNQWGSPETAARLQKMAETIAALTRNAKRRTDSRITGAIRAWEIDLKFLYLDYYVEKLHFAWPETSL